MKKGLLVAAVGLVVFCVHADGFADLFRTAETVNESFLTMTIDFELAELRHEKDRIEATNEGQRLSAESAFLLAQSNFRKSLAAYYHEVLDSVYGAAIADLELRIAESSEALARTEETAAENAVRNGLSPQKDLINARISVRSSAVETEEMSWQWQDALDKLMSATGLSWSDVVLPEIKVLAAGLSEEQWIERDIAVERARIEEEIAEIEYDQLSANAARFDRIMAETELNRARLAAQRAVSTSRRTYESIIRQLTTQAEIITIRTEELILNEKLFQEAEESYRRGMMDASDRDLTSIRVLTARRALIETQRNYLKTVMEYAVAAELPPKDVL